MPAETDGAVNYEASRYSTLVCVRAHADIALLSSCYRIASCNAH